MKQSKDNHMPAKKAKAAKTAKAKAKANANANAKANARSDKAPIVKWTLKSRSKTVETFLHRPSVDDFALEAATKVLKEIRNKGDRAIEAAVKKFDGCSMKAAAFRITDAEIVEAEKQVDAGFKKAAKETRKRIQAFCKNGMREDWSMKAPHGGTLGEVFHPLDRVGCYIPGGAAPLASTAMMTICLAKFAGVPEIVGCTPSKPDGRVNPFLIYAMKLAGATEMYRLGGIQAIGAMAYGTDTIAKVQKIVGPGGPFVTAAKKLVYGEVALDSVAGPSEIAILADDSIPASFVAADLLSQAEHGTGLEKSLLVTDSPALAKEVQRELESQTKALSRGSMIRKVIVEGTLIVTVPDLETGVELINRFAAEHLEILVQNPMRWTKKVRAAGAIFVGPWSPEPVGDFAIGPSHVLPTGGTAAFFSGLTVDDFRRRSSIIHLTKKDLAEVVPVVEAFGRVEGLDAHVRSTTIRFD